MYLSMATVFSQTATTTEKMTIADALDKALQHAQIAPQADKVKLYLSSCSLSEERNTYSFTFYDGGTLLHTISMNNGKQYYSSREIGTTKVFKELDFSKVPAPKDVVIEGVIDKTEKALTALEFGPTVEKLYVNYNLRNDYKNKDQAHHYWNVSMPTGDGTSGKSVGFVDGELSTINNSTIKK